MDPLWIVFAFVFGFTIKQVGLPPLVGFLLAGFALHFLECKVVSFWRKLQILGFCYYYLVWIKTSGKKFTSA